jgi:hypothetical protein
VPGAPSLSQMEPFCSSCFTSTIAQFGAGLSPLQLIGISRPGLP